MKKDIFKLAIRENIGYNVFLKNVKWRVAASPQEVPSDPRLLISLPVAVPLPPLWLSAGSCDP